MRNIQSFFIISALLLIANSSIFANQTFVVEEPANGIFSANITAQPEINYAPAKYFLCGVTFTQMAWSTQLYNCDCGYSFSLQNFKIGYKCSYCNNTFYTKTSALTAIFCDYMNWDNKINKTYSSGNKQTRNNRTVMCQKDKYVQKVAVRTDTQYSFPLGVTGIKFECLDRNLKNQSMVEDNYAGIGKLSALSKNTDDTFISGLKVKANINGQLKGLGFFFQGMPFISNIKINYGSTFSSSPVSYISIETISRQNRDSSISQVNTNWKNNFTVYNIFRTTNKTAEGYDVSKDIIILNPKLASNTSTLTSFQQVSQPFQFGKNFSNTFYSQYYISLLVNSCRRFKFNSLISEQKVNMTFTANLTIVNRFTLLPITYLIVSGNYTGSQTSFVTTSTSEEQISNCQNNSQNIQPQTADQTANAAPKVTTTTAAPKDSTTTTTTASKDSTTTTTTAAPKDSTTNTTPKATTTTTASKDSTTTTTTAAPKDSTTNTTPKNPTSNTTPQDPTSNSASSVSPANIRNLLSQPTLSKSNLMN